MVGRTVVVGFHVLRVWKEELKPETRDQACIWNISTARKAPARLLWCGETLILMIRIEFCQERILVALFDSTTRFPFERFQQQLYRRS